MKLIVKNYLLKSNFFYCINISIALNLKYKRVIKMKIYDYEIEKWDGTKLSLKKYQGKVLLIVNTATRCVFTVQYLELVKLYNKFHDLGFEILDFPCNQFGGQSPLTNDKITEYCQKTFNTQFEQLAKIDVNGKNELPLYTYLKSQNLPEEIKGLRNRIKMHSIKKLSKTYEKENDIIWNFTKFIVDKKGNVLRRYSPSFSPRLIEKDILTLLKV